MITILEVVIQILIVSFGNTVFHVAYMGLTGQQWLICIGFSAITFIVSIFGKIITLDKAIDKCLKYEEEIEDEEFSEDNNNEKAKDKFNKNDYDISFSETSNKADETNICDQNKKKDDADNLKMSDFSLSTEKKTINEEK